MGATAVYELDTEKDKDAQSIFERSQKIQEVNGALFSSITNWTISVYHLVLGVLLKVEANT